MDIIKLWKDMTPEEKGALLLAHHEGKVIQAFVQSTWMKVAKRPFWSDGLAYRVKPEPTVETVTLPLAQQGLRWSHMTAVEDGTHLVTFQTIDGKPDPSSIRMEAL